MTTTDRGRAAEAAAAAYLQRRGHQVLNYNWRNRWCELDLVTRSAAGVHFVEVKYRRRNDWGTGLEAVTPDKLRRLYRAASAWCQAHGYHDSYQLDVISVAGELDHLTFDYVTNVSA